MESIEIIRNILPGESPYKKTEYIILNYNDIKQGATINEENRGILEVVDRAIEIMKDDRNINILKYIMQGKRTKEIADITHLDERNIYRKRIRLIKRLSIILYGDVAL